jgi:hypothetical protein
MELPPKPSEQTDLQKPDFPPVQGGEVETVQKERRSEEAADQACESGSVQKEQISEEATNTVSRGQAMAATLVSLVSVCKSAFWRCFFLFFQSMRLRFAQCASCDHSIFVHPFGVDGEDEFQTPQLKYAWSWGVELKCDFVFEIPNAEGVRTGKYKQRVKLIDEREDDGIKSFLAHVVFCGDCFEIVGFMETEEEVYFLMNHKIYYELTPMLSDQLWKFVNII